MPFNFIEQLHVLVFVITQFVSVFVFGLFAGISINISSFAVESTIWVTTALKSISH